MTTITADFNARTRDDRVRLTTRGALNSFAEAHLSNGEWAWLSDGELRVPARIEIQTDGVFGAADWSLVEEVISPGDRRLEPAIISANVQQLKMLLEQHPRNHRRIWSLVGLVERALPEQGHADYLRSRAAIALGNPEAALLAINDALAKAPARPSFLYQRITVLIELDLDRAFRDAKELVRQSKHALLVAAYAQTQSSMARRAGYGKTKELDEELLQLTESYGASEGIDEVPAGARALVHISRGFAFARLAKRSNALHEFDNAINVAPGNPNSYAARGLEWYPDPKGIRDLEKARALGFLGYWASYFLAHAAVKDGKWDDAERLANEVLLFSPPDRVKANVLEWRAIAAFQRSEPTNKVRGYFGEALALAPDVVRIPQNLAVFENAIRSHEFESHWTITNDEEPTAALLAA